MENILREVRAYISMMGVELVSNSVSLPEFLESRMNGYRGDPECRQIEMRMLSIMSNLSILGGGEKGIILTHSSMPHVAIKYIYCNSEDTDYLIEDSPFRDYTVVGYIPEHALLDYYNLGVSEPLNTNTLIRVKNLNKKYIVETYGTCSIEVVEGTEPSLIFIEREFELNTIIDPSNLNKDLQEHSDDLFRHLIVQYTSIIKQGFFLADMHIGNLTYSSTTNDLKLVDLDYLSYSDEVRDLNRGSDFFHEKIMFLYNFLIIKNLREKYYDFIVSQFN